MTEKEVFFTKAGLEKSEKELEELKSVERRRIANDIKEALAYGDISENAEYDHAKNEQAKLEERIAKLESQISSAVLIDEDNLKDDEVNVGTEVIIKATDSNEEEDYTIVGSAETDPLAGKISNESPMGQALLGKKVGEKAYVETPDGQLEFEIVSIRV